MERLYQSLDLVDRIEPTISGKILSEVKTFFLQFKFYRSYRFKCLDCEIIFFSCELGVFQPFILKLSRALQFECYISKKRKRYPPHKRTEGGRSDPKGYVDILHPSK